MTDFSKVTDEGIAEFAAVMRPLLELRLPFPPSVNSMFVNNKGKGRGRFPSKEYEAWKEQTAWELNAQKPIKVSQRCEIHIDLDDTRKGDADNRIKPCLDALVRHGIIPGDSKKHVQRVSAGWGKLSGCRVRIVGAAE